MVTTISRERPAQDATEIIFTDYEVLSSGLNISNEQKPAFDLMLKIMKAKAVITVQEVVALERDDVQEHNQAVAAQRSDRLTLKILAYGITIGFFIILGTILHGDVPEKGKEVLLVMLGSLTTAWTGIIGYYFGSSSGSSRKDLPARTVSVAPPTQPKQIEQAA